MCIVLVCIAKSKPQKEKTADNNIADLQMRRMIVLPKNKICLKSQKQN